MFGGGSDLLAGLLVVPAVVVAGLVVVLIGADAWVVPIVIGAALSGFGGYNLAINRKSKNWMRREGRMVSTGIGEHSVAVTEVSRQTFYFPEVEFEYSIQGREYRSHKVALDIKSVWNPDKNAIAGLLEKYPVGATVPIFVDPGEHGSAVLVLGLSRFRRSHYRALVVSGILVAAVGGLAYVLKN